MVNRLLNYDIGDEKVESEETVPTNVIDLVAVLQESLRRSSAVRKRLATKAEQSRFQIDQSSLTRPSLVRLSSAEPGGLGAFQRYIKAVSGVFQPSESEATVYYIPTGLVIRPSQLANLLLATATLTISICCIAASLFVHQFAALAPWFFWLIPALGSLGVALGVWLNVIQSKGKS